MPAVANRVDGSPWQQLGRLFESSARHELPDELVVLGRHPRVYAHAVEQPLAPAPAPAEDGAVFLMQARSEGLELIRGPNTTGFKGVSFNSRAVSGRQFQAQPYYDGKQVYLGSYGTAEEAELMVARHLATRA